MRWKRNRRCGDDGKGMWKEGEESCIIRHIKKRNKQRGRSEEETGLEEEGKRS